MEGDSAYMECAVRDALRKTEDVASQLLAKFVRAMDDLELFLKTVLALNGQGGHPKPVLSADMCCCRTADWRELGRSSPWAGYADCSDNRAIEVYYGNASIEDSAGVFRQNRTRDTDLAFAQASAVISPWIVERQKQQYDKDSFYTASWLWTTGEITTYYPGFNKFWPGHTFGDSVGGDWYPSNTPFVAPTLPENDPTRTPCWTRPYKDPATGGNMISAIAPLYFTGNFRGQQYQDVYMGTGGIDIVLQSFDERVARLRPTPSALSFIVDDDGRLVSAEPAVVQAIFSENATIDSLIGCAGDVACLVGGSSQTGNWSELMRAIRATPEGGSGVVRPMVIVQGGVEQVSWHVAVFHRWSGRLAPKWSSVVVLPVVELQSQASWTLPSSITASASKAGGAATVSFAFANTGRGNFTYRLIRVPEWVSVRSPGWRLSGLDESVTFPAGATVQYELLLDAGHMGSAGSRSGSMVWELVTSDQQCDVHRDAAMEVVLTQPHDGQEWVIPVLVSAGAFLLLLLLALAARHLYRRHKQFRLLKKQAARATEEKLNTAELVASTMAFPIHLLPVKEFAVMKRLTPYEELRDRGALRVVDAVRDLQSILFIFFSHQWTAWTKPDHTGRQYRLMCDSITKVLEEHRRDPADWHVWVDYISVPQRHLRMQELAILSLPVYASRATVFVVIAPTVEHLNTKEVCDLSSYMSRAWCRAEQLSHAASCGMEFMYQATDEGISRMDQNAIASALRVFEGKLTCCSQQHRGRTTCDKELLVLPVLGVYARLLRMATIRTPERERMSTGSAACETVLQMVEVDEGAIFPRDFLFQGPGVREHRMLFGDLVTKLRSRIDESLQPGQEFSEVASSENLKEAFEHPGLVQDEGPRWDHMQDEESPPIPHQVVVPLFLRHSGDEIPVHTAKSADLVPQTDAKADRQAVAQDAHPAGAVVGLA